MDSGLVAGTAGGGDARGRALECRVRVGKLADQALSKPGSIWEVFGYMKKYRDGLFGVATTTPTQRRGNVLGIQTLKKNLPGIVFVN